MLYQLLQNDPDVGGWPVTLGNLTRWPFPRNLTVQQAHTSCGSVTPDTFALCRHWVIMEAKGGTQKKQNVSTTVKPEASLNLQRKYT